MFERMPVYEIFILILDSDLEAKYIPARRQAGVFRLRSDSYRNSVPLQNNIGLPAKKWITIKPIPKKFNPISADSTYT